MCGQQRFQPTSPVRETTWIQLGRSYLVLCISTHVPRAGDDRQSGTPCARNTYFNPRPPCGRRQGHLFDFQFFQEFQPTSPVRETTYPFGCLTMHIDISTHVPRAGDDISGRSQHARQTYFNPRPPCGRRLLQINQTNHPFLYFNPRPPCGRRRARCNRGRTT